MEITELFSRAEIIKLAAQYDYKPNDTADLEQRIRAAVKRSYMTREDLIAVASWKWRGSVTAELAAKNTEDDVSAITQASFANENERLRISVLLGLSGVGFPMASVILHFAFPHRYPILDRFMMVALGRGARYTFDVWSAIFLEFREASRNWKLPIREIEKALWVDRGEKLAGTIQ